MFVGLVTLVGGFRCSVPDVSGSPNGIHCAADDLTGARVTRRPSASPPATRRSRERSRADCSADAAM